jgi:hypothetical protein
VQGTEAFSVINLTYYCSRWCNGYHACHLTQGSLVKSLPIAINFKGHKNYTSFGGEIKPSAPYHNIYSMLKIPRGMIDILKGKMQGHFLQSFCPLC